MTQPPAPILKIGGLSKRFGTGPKSVLAVDDVSFEVRTGETVGLVGESGSGKSTTGYCALQLVTPTAGSVLLEGQELVGMSPRRLRLVRKDMQMVFQDPYDSLDPRMSVADSVAEPFVIHSRMRRGKITSRVNELLELVGISPDEGDRRPSSFSGGQRQRVSIARALALDPKLIICDEAASALDVSIQAQIINLLRDLQVELGLSYLFISHDLAVIRAVGDFVVVMQHGKVVETGTAHEIFETPRNEYTRKLLDAVPITDPRYRTHPATPAADQTHDESEVNA